MALAHKVAPDVQVFVAGQLRQDVQVHDVVLCGGAAKLPMATLEVQPPGRTAGRRQLLNMSLARFNQAEVEIVVAGRVIHWGRALQQPVSLDGTGGDLVRLVSRMDPHHFGRELRQAWFYNPATKNPLGLDLPTVFNPEWDGRVVPNRSTKTHRQKRYHLFQHPSTAETDPARLYHSSDPDWWTLPTAVFYLCWTLNPDEERVENPTLAELRRVLPGDVELLRNHECPAGDYLPDQLERLLVPLGFGWTVDFVKRGQRKIRCYARGEGRERLLKLQRPGATVDMGQSNLEGLNLAADVASRACNAARVLGDFIRVEATFELVKGWPSGPSGKSTQYDDLSEDELRKNADGWFDNPDYANVWRKWVLNEAGDYIGARREIREPYDLTQLFVVVPDLEKKRLQILPRRRHFEPCLSLHADGSPRGHSGGVDLEFFDNDSQEWISADLIGSEGRTFRVLDRECGIYFDGLTIPSEIRAQDSAGSVRVRVTATLASDYRVAVLVKDHPRSLLADYKELTLNLPSRFKQRYRHSSSRFEQVDGPVSQIDDQAAMQRFGRQVLDAWNLASIEGTVTLTAIDFDLSEVIGTTITGIDGRQVDFNVSPVGRRFPTVVGATVHVARQAVSLVLDTFRQTDFSSTPAKRPAPRLTEF